jgi:nicotinamidase/pyrazinamidase
MRRALLVVDTQPTFCEGGGLPVEGGNAAAERIGRFVAAAALGHHYDEIVASQDWHIAPGEHWAPDGAAPDFAVSWPRHGPAGEPEADLHPALLAALGAEPGTVPPAFSALVRKGMHEAAYSAFEGVVVEDPDELDPTGMGLAEWLRARDITDVDVCGIATDHCDRATTLDAVAAGFRTRLIVDLTVGVAPETTAAALEEMAAAGVEIVRSHELDAGAA